MFFNLFQVVYFPPFQFFFPLCTTDHSFSSKSLCRLEIFLTKQWPHSLRYFCSLSGTYTSKHCRFLTKKIPEYMSKFPRSVGRATWIMSTIDVPPAEIS